MLKEKITKLRNHLAMLDERHAKLDEEIAKLESNPAIPDETVQQLKKEKLYIKDELANIRAELDKFEESL